LIHFIHQYSLFAISSLIAFEYLGFPLPNELAYVASSGMVAAGKIQYWQIFVIILLSHAAGAFVAYSLGRRARRLTKRSKRLEGVQLKLEKWYETYGAITVVGAQLVGHIRPWTSYVAGFSRVPLGKFMFYSTLGSAILTVLMLSLADTLVALWHHYPSLRLCLASTHSFSW
jgi:membrane protein DedA with SNARE-associated domain